MAGGDEAAVRLCAPYLRALPIEGVSISVGVALDLRSTVASSDSVAAQLDSLQFELGQGPSCDVLQYGDRSLAFDLRQDAFLELWPLFTGAAIEAGAGAVFVFPMLAGAITVGVVSLYSASAAPAWPESLVHSAAVLVQSSVHPAVVLATAGARSCSEARDGPSGVRREVHQASGMVSVQVGCSIEEAMLLLRARALTKNRTVHSVALDVVDRLLTFPLTG